jgi:hypothetical protein
VPRASSSLLARRGASLARRPWKCRRLGGLGDAAACPHKGPAVARPLDRGAAATDLGTTTTTPDRGTAATARRGQGAAATAATDRGPPPRALSGNRRRRTRRR